MFRKAAEKEAFSQQLLRSWGGGFVKYKTDTRHVCRLYWDMLQKCSVKWADGKLSWEGGEK